MAIAPGDFQLTAKYLLSPTASEANWRSAVSRAYYALYQTFRLEVMNMPRQLRDKAGLGSKANVPHDKLIMALTNCPATRNIGNDLNTLRDARTLADYHFSQTLTYSMANNFVNLAQKCLVDIAAAGMQNLMSAFSAYLNT